MPSRRQAPTFGPYSAQERACLSSTPDFSGLPIGPMPGAASSAQPSSMTLTEIASGRSFGQPLGKQASVVIPTPVRSSALGVHDVAEQLPGLALEALQLHSLDRIIIGRAGAHGEAGQQHGHTELLEARRLF